MTPAMAPFRYPYQKELAGWLYALWTRFYKAPSDTKPEFRKTIGQLRADFFQAEWHWVFDFLEFSAKQSEELGHLLIKC